MSHQASPSLFSPLSPETMSQTNGGNWAKTSYSTASSVVVRFRYYPGEAGNTTINITNPELDDGSVLNIGGDGITNITNPEVDDKSSVSL